MSDTIEEEAWNGLLKRKVMTEAVPEQDPILRGPQLAIESRIENRDQTDSDVSPTSQARSAPDDPPAVARKPSGTAARPRQSEHR